MRAREHLSRWRKDSWARAEVEATDDWEQRSRAGKAGGCLNVGCTLGGCLPWMIAVCAVAFSVRRLPSSARKTFERRDHGG